MNPRTIVENQAFQYIAGTSVLVVAVDSFRTYAETGRVNLVSAAASIVIICVFVALLVTYWNYMERRAEAE